MNLEELKRGIRRQYEPEYEIYEEIEEYKKIEKYLINENKELKERIDKAIEYIEKHNEERQYQEEYIPVIENNIRILNILKGKE